MAVPLSLGPVHHLRLTVTDVDRSRAFYTDLLGFQIAMDAPPPADDPHHDLATDLLQAASAWLTATCCSGCARWTPSGPTIVSTRSAAAWTT
jgi:glyoxylase I family protein